MSKINALTAAFLDKIRLSNLAGTTFFGREKSPTEYLRAIQQVIIQSIEYENKGELDKAIQYTLLLPKTTDLTLKSLLTTGRTEFNKQLTRKKLQENMGYTPIYAITQMVDMVSAVPHIETLLYLFELIMKHMIDRKIPLEHDIGNAKNLQTMSIIDYLALIILRMKRTHGYPSEPTIRVIEKVEELIIYMFPIPISKNDNQMRYYPVDIFRTSYLHSNNPNNKIAEGSVFYHSPIFRLIDVGASRLIKHIDEYCKQPAIGRSIADIIDARGNSTISYMLLWPNRMNQYRPGITTEEYYRVFFENEWIQYVPRQPTVLAMGNPHASALFFATLTGNHMFMNQVYEHIDVKHLFNIPAPTIISSKIVTHLMIGLFHDTEAMTVAEKAQMLDTYSNMKSFITQLKEGIITKEEVVKWREFMLSELMDDWDYMMVDGPQYFFHKHDSMNTEEKSTGVSAKSFDYYLSKFTDAPDKRNIPCMIADCPYKLSIAEMSALASPNVWSRFFKSSYVADTALSHTIPLYDMILSNTATRTDAFGTIHHETICPFCIQPVSRENGCIYMKHDLPKTGRINASERPYCDPKFVVKELRDLYYNKAREIYQNAGKSINTKLDDLSFCIECGRPCWRHTHFSLDKQSFIDPVMGLAGYDQGKCPGGGVVEKFARILAIRDVYSSGKYKNEKEERRAAAFAADEAPNNPELMRRAAAVHKSKEWNMPLVPHAYMSQHDNGDEKEEIEINIQLGGKRRALRKMRKHAKSRIMRRHVRILHATKKTKTPH